MCDMGWSFNNTPYSHLLLLYFLQFVNTKVLHYIILKINMFMKIYLLPTKKVFQKFLIFVENVQGKLTGLIFSTCIYVSGHNMHLCKVKILDNFRIPKNSKMKKK